jgi:hyperosmotically inducible periplasmic protein
MTTTTNPGQISLGTAIVAAALLFGMNMSHAASDTDAVAPANAVNKAERVVSDSWITTKVKSEILANSASKAFKVSVKTKHGVVLLKGKLLTQDAIDVVKLIAEKVKGVKSVDVSGLVIRS